MSFVHENEGEFADLVQIVAAERGGVLRSIVEKDYWVTHTLWALMRRGFDVWFKGGTSLSKGFGLIERFSEDLDLKIEAGKVSELPFVSSWKSEGVKATQGRKAYFEALAELLDVPGCRIELEVDTAAKGWRSANLRVLYPGLYVNELPAVLSPNVRLEISSARVTPFITRDIGSWVHDKLAATNALADFDDNRALGVRCVDPLVTLLEKIDAIRRRFPNEQALPQTFVRHYEDAARIIEAGARFPAPQRYATVRALSEEMLAKKQLASWPTPDDPALIPTGGARWKALETAHAALEGMFWGPRLSLERSSEIIRAWVALELG